MQMYATRLLGDAAAAEDVVQEALIRLWRNPDVLTNGKGSVRGWLLTVVRHIVIDGARARGARPTEVPGSLDTPPVQRDHADAVAASVTVHEALGRLSPEHRAVLEQIHLHGRNLDEAARALGIPKGTVKSRSFYAIRALREIMSSMPVSRERRP
ncbi:MAG: polymerase sigma-70 factor, subfamily [Pseudonocardiales bacterium]|jgi:RNA polymerase sigma-70 factor (ECF subfamily)|uniref:sigma-70 family RNA polymerase sigma factor n=1 Tax=Pseudonocardia sp. TaxID=60912 RepID=UPI00262688D9|nr:sigma-70 family RNA polymerase sigma factor [Pseudonocardia sp.]MCW2718114.1 polymerase [Pseudonocardia sp.]MDT7617675.1 polymerase sigma-70 factor, subfamily [Pseudonocardiales bacterium]MDT7705619.1 polymerase sigma-70 factor, subfamily [Pseudonocardiales bacterium]